MYGLNETKVKIQKRTKRANIDAKHAILSD